MHLISTHATRFGRTTAALLATAATLAIAGCQSGPVSNDTMGGGSNNAGGSGGTTVATSTTTTPKGGNSGATGTTGSSGMADTTGGMGTTQFFPLGVEHGEVLKVDADGPKTVRLNQTATYNLKVTNLTGNAVHNIMLMSTNPDGFQVTSAAPATTQPMDKGMGYALGDLGPMESKTIMITGMATKVGSVDTCYTVTYNPPTLCTMLQVTNPAIALTVQAQPDMDICKPATYTYTVANTGTGTAHNVMVMEDLPDGLMTADGSKSVSNTIGDIPQGESRNFVAQLKASKTGPMSGTAKAMADGQAAPTAATMTTVHAPILTVDVAAAKPSLFVGQTATFMVTVTNKGDTAAPDTMLKIGHPANSMGTVTAEGVDSTGTVAVGELAPGASKTVNVTANSTTGGDVTVMANAMSACAATVSGQAMTTFNTIPALLLETVDEHDPVTVGGTVVYDVKVTNQGSGPDNNVSVKATIPDGEEYISTSGPTQPQVDGMTLTFPTIPVLGTKESATWKVSVKAAKAADVQFRTTASCDGTAPAEKVEPTKLTPQ